MKSVQLGKTNIQLSEIIMGCWVTGGAYWGGADDQESINAIHQALDLGVHSFDTAYIYGNGHSENVLGQAVAGKRDQVQLISKLWKDSMSKDKVRPACEDSLRRLKTDYLDVYFIHYPSDDGIPVEETLGEMNRLKEEGKIRAIGLSNFSLAQMKEAMQFAQIDIIQPCYSLVWRFIDADVLPFCREHDIGVIPYSPIAQGLLTGKFTRDTVFADNDGRSRAPIFQSPWREGALEIVDVMRPIAEKYQKTLAQLAINWVNQVPGITAAIVGGRTAAQLRDNAGACGWQLDEQDWQTLDKASAAFCATLPKFRNFFDATVIDE